MTFLNSSTFHCIDYPSAVWKTRIEYLAVHSVQLYALARGKRGTILVAAFLVCHTFKIWRLDWISLCPDLKGSFTHHNTKNTMLNRIFLFLVIFLQGAGTITCHFHGRFLLGAICKRIHLFTHNFDHSTFELNDAKAMAQNALPLAPRYLLLLFASLRLLSPVLLPSRFSGLLPRSHLNTLNKCCWNVRHKLQMPLLYGWYPLKKPLRAG